MNKDCDPTGEKLFTTEPRPYVIEGRLAELKASHGVNSQKFRSFELVRRNLLKPEIITFDELDQRACFIVDSEVSK